MLQADHECAASSGSSLSCDRCGKSFATAARLNFHRSAHKKVKALKNRPHVWKCDKCQMTFATSKGRDQVRFKLD
jgi:ribosomal protein L37AE/L43A